VTQRADAGAKPTIEVYHDRSECHIGRLILEDHNEAFGEGGRPRCAECRKYGGDLSESTSNQVSPIGLCW
jgi:hypothetical protein